MTAAAHANTYCSAAGTAASRSASCCANCAASCCISVMDTACAVSIFVMVVLLALGLMDCVSVLLAGLIVRLCSLMVVRLWNIPIVSPE